MPAFLPACLCPRLPGPWTTRWAAPFTRLIESGDFSGEAGKTALLYAGSEAPAARVLVVGLGQLGEFDLQAARKASAVAAKAVAELKGVKSFVTALLGGSMTGLEPAAAAQALAEGTLLALYQAPQYKREPATGGPESCVVLEPDADRLPAIEAGLAAGKAIAAGVYAARNYVSEPPNVLYPKVFAERAIGMAEAVGLSWSVLGKTEMRELGMGLALAVASGSKHKPRLIILEHTPPDAAEEPPLVLVGKGITFDTGGISIKPSENMWHMKNDMSGAAAVIGAMEAIARLGLPRRVIGLAICVENMPDGKAYRPGDIITGITGKTAEVLNTDAEGRLVLGDALGYAARFEPAAVVDLATLTGAIGIALGRQAAGLFANDDALQSALLDAAEHSGERLWPMPMYSEYADDIKSDMAEVNNIGSRAGGVSTSAKFIEHFTEGYPWAHLDIAAMVWTDADANPLNPKGATGYGVRLLVELARLA